MTDDKKFLMPNAAAEIYTDEGCFITELLNTDAEPNVSVARARVASGITTMRHYSVSRRALCHRKRLGDIAP